MINTTPQLKHVHSQTFAYFIVMVGLGAVMVSLGPVLPRLATQTRTDLGTLGLIFSFRSIGFLGGSLMGGRMFDRLPAHPVFAASLLLMGVTVAAIPLIQAFWLLLVVMLLSGLASGFLIVGCNTLLVWVRAGNVGPWMNAMSFFNGMGGFLVPILISGFLTRTGEFGGAFLVLGIILGLFALGMLFVPSPAIRTTTTATDSSGRIRYGLVSLFAMVFLLYVGAEMSFSGWLYTFTVAVHPDATAAAALLTSAFWAGIAVGRLLAIPVSSRVRARSILLFDFVGSLLSLTLILVFSSSLAALWVGTIGFGLCMASLFPTWMTFADRRIQVNGKITGIFFAATSLGSMFFPWLCGKLFVSSGPDATMLVILLALLVAAGVFGVMMVFIPLRPSPPAAG